MLSEQQQERFTQLWTEAQPFVGQYLASLLSDQIAVKDALQNTALTLLRKFGDYNENRPFLPWALGMAKYEYLGQKRDAARSKIVCNTDFLDRYTQVWSEAAPRLSTEASALKDCVTKLPERQREIVRLRYFEDLNAVEIAPRMTLTSANVRAILKRTRDALRRCVEERLRLEGSSP